MEIFFLQERLRFSKHGIIAPRRMENIDGPCALRVMRGDNRHSVTAVTGVDIGPRFVYFTPKNDT